MTLDEAFDTPRDRARRAEDNGARWAGQPKPTTERTRRFPGALLWKGRAEPPPQSVWRPAYNGEDGQGLRLRLPGTPGPYSQANAARGLPALACSIDWRLVYHQAPHRRV